MEKTLFSFLIKTFLLEMWIFKRSAPIGHYVFPFYFALKFFLFGVTTAVN